MNQKEPIIITAGQHTDERGRLSFFNDFDMTPVKRFYIIEHPDPTVIRAWQGHKVEQKWFYAIAGSFKVVLVLPGDWENPSENVEVKEFILEEGIIRVLYIPGGYANGFKALAPNSKMMIFSDFSIADAGKDDFRFDKTMWYDWKKNQRRSAP
jgi:dTDP-4-dehydrorhamnose 3,5-epimerase-like enzyme